MSEEKIYTKEYVPAIPPSDYKGTIADWIIGLNIMGLDGKNYFDLEISADDWWKLLEDCER